MNLPVPGRKSTSTRPTPASAKRTFFALISAASLGVAAAGVAPAMRVSSTEMFERLVTMIRAVTLVTALCVAFTTPAAPQGLLDFFKFILPAQTFEQARTKTKQGYGAQLHGKVKIKGKSFDFVSGGRGRGSAPFGTYRVGPLSGFKTPKGTWIPGYHLSDAYDPFVNDTRAGLFIHPGHNASAGCVAIRKDQWPSFVKAIAGAAKVGRPLAIRLGPGSEPMQEKPLASVVKYVSHKRSAGRRKTIKAHLRSHTRTHHRRKA